MFDHIIFQKIWPEIVKDSNVLIMSIQILAIYRLITYFYMHTFSQCTHVHAHQDTRLTFIQFLQTF